jgi:hypothetical protein
MEYKDKDENFLFESSNDDQNQELAFLNKETKNQDGIYRPNVKDAADPKGAGYKATIRFLRNVYADGSGTGPAAITKHVHYVKPEGPLEEYTDLAGYYDCEKNISQQTPCPLCQTYWKLYKSNNQADVIKSGLIKRSTKFYSYIMVIEDEQHPELVGKILIYPYGPKIKAKINSEINGEVTGEKCNIFDFVTGKDFRLIIKEIATPSPDGRSKIDMPNYDTSTFLTSSPLKIWNEKANKFVTPPTTVDDETGKVAIADKKWQAKIKEVILSRPATVNLDVHAPDKDGWDDAKRANVEKIVQILNGSNFQYAESSIKKSGTKAPAAEVIEEESFDDLFDFEDDK